MTEPAPIVIGAGPAGVRAAERLVEAGLRPVVIDENQRAGGQIYRQPPAGFSRSARSRYGFEAKRAVALHESFAAILDRVEYMPNSTVWNLEPNRLWIYDTQQTSSLHFTRLIVASGATDRIIPVPGWTLPGVFSLGGAQVSLKAQACSIGRRVVFAGTGPLLYLVAYQYMASGVDVAAVVDTGRSRDRLLAAPSMAARPATLAKGLFYMAKLRLNGVRLVSGACAIAIHGDARPEAVSWRVGDRRERVTCDAVGIGFGLRPETQIADLAECRFHFDELEGTWLPEQDEAGRSSVPGIYLAGDGAGIFGADAAEAAGRRAAEALLSDISRPAALRSRPVTDRIFKQGMARAFRLPEGWMRSLPDDTVICRCEEVRLGEIRAAIREAEIVEINRLKALTRVGMGRCQGRMCGLACQAVLADQTGRSLENVGRLRGQSPIKPLPIDAIAGGSHVDKS